MKREVVRRIILLGILFMVGLAAPVFGDEPGVGILEGQIINGTAGGASVAGVKINLDVLRNGAAQTPSVTVADSEGGFIFNHLATDAAYTYKVSATFQGAAYESDPMTFSAGTNSISANITVYNATKNDGAISVALAHTILYPQVGSTLVKEYFLFTNSGDQTYIGPVQGSANGTLLFSLPPGATEFTATIGAMDSIGGNNIVDTTPVLPGMHEVAYSYKLNRSLANLTFTSKIIYNTSRFDFLIQGEDYSAASDQLAPDDLMVISNVKYTHLSGKDLRPGTSLAVRLSAASSTAGRGSLWLVITGAVVLIAAGIVSIYFIRRKRREPVFAQDNLTQRRAQLLDEIAELDDRFEDGSIKEEYYRKLRDAKKAELSELTRKQKGV